VIGLSVWGGSDTATVDDVVTRVRTAASEGFPSIWFPQTAGLDALTALAVAAVSVPTIRLGTAVVPIQGRHPIPLAQQALTVADAAGPGRFTLADREVSPVRLTRTGGAVAERERSHTRPLGGVFVAHSQVLSAADVQRALTRMAHEVVERNGGVEDVVLVGLQTGGVPLATRMAEIAEPDRGRRPCRWAASTWPSTATTSAAPRPARGGDRHPGRPGRQGRRAGRRRPLHRPHHPGRPQRLNDFGRARAVQLAVMVDRGHRELPIRPDYVGKNLPTRREEMVDVGDEGVWIGTLENK
jgi:pyrimidine operon attenuation protein/uracil phosphoribosyltransferase